jgi:hypothetical protein
MYHQKFIHVDNNKLQNFIFGEINESLNENINEILDDL